MNPYFADILAQPAALRKAISQFPHPVIEKIQEKQNNGDFDRIVMTGMGASYNAAYPALLQIMEAPVPPSLLNSAELSHFLNGMLGERTLLWLNSQSGRSVELLNILENIKTRPVASTLSFTNNGNSPLALATDFSIPIQAGEESIISTKTYINMLATNLLSAIQLVGGDLSAAVRDLQLVADEMEAYLTNWDSHVKQIDNLLSNVNRLFILGRGPSMSTVWNGSLVCKEAAKFPAEGMIAADFRHGPLELVAKDVTVIFIEGVLQTSKINKAFAEEIAQFDANVIWVSPIPHSYLPTLLIPQVPELFLPIVEILPMQLLSASLAKKHGLIAGQFHRIGKVTSKE